MPSNAKKTVAMLIPSGIGLGYSGPGVFLKRLMTPLQATIDFRVLAGVRPGQQLDPDFVPARSMPVGNSNGIRQLLWALRATAWIIQERKTLDLVHFHGTYLYKLIPALACIASGIPYVLVPLASGADMSLKGKASRFPGVRRLLRFIVARATASFALGQDIETELYAAGATIDRIHPIFNPVSDDFFAEEASERRSKNTILFVGVLGSRKRPTLVLEALRKLLNTGVPARALFLGPFITPEYASMFNTGVAELGLRDSIEHVEYTEDVASYMLNESSVFLLPSETEGLPGALAEAMAAGLPCVVTDAGSMREIVSVAECGTVVEADSSEIAREVQKILMEQELWDRYSSNARSYANANFRSTSCAQGYLDVITRSLGA